MRSLRCAARTSTGPSRRAAAAARVFRVALAEPRARRTSACGSTTGAAASTSSATARGASAVVANLGALWVEAERLAGRPLDPLDPGLVARAWLMKTPVALAHRLPRQRQDDAALAAARAPRDGRDGGDRQRARRGRRSTTTCCAGSTSAPCCSATAASAARCAATSPTSCATSLGRRDRGEIPALPARRRRDDGPRRPRADPLHAALRAGRQAPLRARARDHDRGRRQHGLRGAESVQQAAVADRLVVTKTDLADAARRRARAATRSTRRPRSSRRRSATSTRRRSSAAPSADPRELAVDEPARPHDGDVRAFCLSFDEQLDWTAFGIWLTMLLQARGERRPARQGAARTSAATGRCC